MEQKMEDNNFWLRIWTLVACVLIVFIAACTTDHVVRRTALTNSSDPVALACAMEQGSLHYQACAVVVAREAHK